MVFVSIVTEILLSVRTSNFLKEKIEFKSYTTRPISDEKQKVMYQNLSKKNADSEKQYFENWLCAFDFKERQ